MELKVIARARNGFKDKFGIPRQTDERTLLLTRIVFEPDYRVKESLRGIEQFSHLWLLWGFHDLKNATSGAEAGMSWSPTVRPPRLGGNTRVGVFATRSPYRPNPIGMSSVRLLGVEQSATEGYTLLVSGADMLDGTPVYDIKPYLAYTDSHPDAADGFAANGLKDRLTVVWDDTSGMDSRSKEQVEEVLSYDPRPAYQNDMQRIYHLRYDKWEVSFRVEEKLAIVVKIIKCES